MILKMDDLKLKMIKELVKDRTNAGGIRRRDTLRSLGRGCPMALCGGCENPCMLPAHALRLAYMATPNCWLLNPAIFPLAPAGLHYSHFLIKSDDAGVLLESVIWNLGSLRCTLRICLCCHLGLPVAFDSVPALGKSSLAQPMHT